MPRRPPLHSFWFNRFQVFDAPGDQYRFRDWLTPQVKQVNANKFIGLQGDKLHRAFFRHGFMHASISAFKQPVAQHPHNASDSLFWQFPCRTEGAAWEAHSIQTEPPLHDDSLHVYLGLPWATWIDRERKEAWGAEGSAAMQLQMLTIGVRLSGLRHALNELGIQLKVHTVCQHIYWQDMAPTWRRLGVTDVWLSHFPESGLNPAGLGFDVHPWALYAVNVEDPERRAGLQEGKEPSAKPVLASFVGTHAAHYLSDVRLRLCTLSKETGFVVQLTDKWHFEDVVYQHQMGKASLKASYTVDNTVASYNQLLSDSIFSLCPAGAGPNTLRLWESLAVGAVPVLLGRVAAMPRGGNLPAIDWEKIVVRCTDEQIKDLPLILRAMPMDEIRRRQNLGMEAYALVRKQQCF